MQTISGRALPVNLKQRKFYPEGKIVFPIKAEGLVWSTVGWAAPTLSGLFAVPIIVKG
jgi:hypothetical protein